MLGAPAHACRQGSHPIDLEALINDNLSIVVAVLAVMALLAFLLAFVAWRRAAGLERRLQGLTRGSDGRNLEAVLDAHLDKVFAVAKGVDDLNDRTAALEAASRTAFSRVGLVRFNPFEDTGGNQSFALALLDARGNGWILSSLHSRGATRVYAKTVTAGRSDAALSEEEAQAIRQASA